MTSKEALETLFACYCYNGNYQEVIEAREKLEKDLEVLNILKKHIYSSDSSISIILDDLRKYDDFKKVKEWLENE